MSCTIGIFATILLIFAGKSIFAIFIPEAEAISAGAIYLRILAYSQFFMCIEITTTGAFSGLGNTVTPSLVSIIPTGLRIPVAILLSGMTALGLNGVWWSISGTSIVKGILLLTLFIFMIIIPNRKKFQENVDI